MIQVKKTSWFFAAFVVNIIDRFLSGNCQTDYLLRNKG
jgi:hypothetical protein